MEISHASLKKRKQNKGEKKQPRKKAYYVEMTKDKNSNGLIAGNMQLR
jgi:hypothetical protein